MAAHARANPGEHDGAAGSVAARTEPKVRAATVAATLTSAVLYLLHAYVPGVAELTAVLPGELEAAVAVLVTGAVTWLAGFATRAVDRIDLFEEEEAGPAVTAEVPSAAWLVDQVTEAVFDRLAAAGVLEGSGPPTAELSAVTRRGVLPRVPGTD